MKVYVLTCVNECSEIVSIDLFLTHAQARSRVEENFQAECEDLEKRRHLDYEKIEHSNAECGDSEYYYSWEIHTREL